MSTLPPPAKFSVDLSDVDPSAIVLTVEYGGTTLHIPIDPEQAALLGATLTMASYTALLAVANVELAKREQQCP